MPLVDVVELTKRFTNRGRLFARSATRAAVDCVSFSIEEGETFGLVGESGSGKTTTGRCMLRLIEPTSGQVMFRGEDICRFDRKRLRAARRELQIVFQDPTGSLNPRLRAVDIVQEPLIIHGIGTKQERRDRVAELFELVGLDTASLDRFPRQFSGGQRQRIGLARALALNPQFVILDEPVSALDVSVQAQVVTLLSDLQERLGLTYLFITHDLRLVRHLCPRMAVMCRGRIVEMGKTSGIFAAPQHPYTRALLSAMPSIDPDRPMQRASEPPVFDEQTPLRSVGDDHLAAI